MHNEEFPSGTVAVGVDGSTSSELALGWAVEEAQATGRSLTLVHGVGPVGGVWMDQSGHDSRAGVEHAQTYAQRLIEEARSFVASRDPSLDVYEHVRVADPRDVLLDVSRRASVIVMGSRGRGPVRALLLGSVGVAVTRHAASPVVILRPAESDLLRQGVLVGVDGTEHSRRPLEFAFRQASQRGLPLTVLHAFPGPWDERTAPEIIDRGAQEYEEQRLLLAEIVAGMREDHPDVPVRTDLARGEPGECLVRMGSHMDLLVVGAHRGGAAAAVLFGSVATWVVEHATCPVAVVPTGDPAA